MKKRLLILTVIAVLTVSALGACAKNGDAGSDAAATSAPVNTGTGAKATDTPAVTGDAGTSDITADPAQDGAGTSDGSDAAPAEGLTVTTEVADGWSEKNGVYTITKAGEYKFSGTLSEGRIVVNAKGQEVSVILSGVTLSSKEDSVIYIENAEEATVVAQNGTVNTLNDNRARKVGNQELAGNACIYSKDDLSVQGQGTLIINASYNKGIHTKNDLKIKNLTLEVNAVGTAIQGNDSVTIKSGNITLVSTENDGITTKDTDVSSKGKQRGVVTIEGGTVSITAKDECINAAYDVQIDPSAQVTQQKY
ncbi:MAG: carbohydrate-binding domain-containing protein [Lachnospiraceae bacterium]|nr:carbohydrate-binding domain-containing protein [Lachnospiraceae bacterium]